MRPIHALFLMSSLALAGCQATGESYDANTFDASQINQQQEAVPVTVLSLSAAKVRVDNAEGRRRATLGGALIGAVGGALLGSAGRHPPEAPVVTGAAGALGGAAVGSMASDSTLVPGVIIGYREGNATYSSTQVGRTCQYAIGRQALLVKTQDGQTRVQPNASCSESGS